MRLQLHSWRLLGFLLVAAGDEAGDLEKVVLEQGCRGQVGGPAEQGLSCGRDRRLEFFDVRLEALVPWQVKKTLQGRIRLVLVLTQ